MAIAGVNDAPTLASITPVTINDTAANDTPVPFTGHLVGADIDHGAVLTYSLADGVAATNAYGTLTLDAATGAYAFAADSTALNALADGENQAVSFGVLVTDEHGATAAQAIHFNLFGANDGPTLAGIDPVAVNDTDVNDAPAPFIGQLAGADVDHGAVLTYSLADGVAATNAYGALTLDAATGAYAFTVEPTALNTLAAGENQAVSFGVLVTDEHGATAAQAIQFNLVGANDTAEITGGVAGAVTEDGTLTANGALTVSDRDHGQSLFIAANDADLHGQYGDFTFNTNGEWSYLLRNGDTSVQALNSGDAKTDSLLVTSLDGSATETISVTINGVNEPVVVTPAAAHNPIHDINNGLSNVNNPSHGLITDFISGDYLNLLGSVDVSSQP